MSKEEIIKIEYFIGVFKSSGCSIRKDEVEAIEKLLYEHKEQQKEIENIKKIEEYHKKENGLLRQEINKIKELMYQDKCVEGIWQDIDGYLRNEEE